MTDFLLEVLSEEIPAGMQKAAAENFLQISQTILTKNNLILTDEQIKVLITPRRLTLYISNLSQNQESPAIIKVGPKIEANEKAIAGFARSVGISDISQLDQVEKDGNLCYAFSKAASEVKTSTIIENALPQILQRMTNAWPKLMRWDVVGLDYQPKWIRPIRNIAALFGDEIVNVEFAGLQSNNKTFVNFIKSSEPIQISNAQHYHQLMEDHLVILDPLLRKEKIIEEINKITAALNLKTIDKADTSPLFDEVTGLCESPTVLVGSIDESFMELPDEILILTLKLNQRYFCLENNEGQLASKFIFVTNCEVRDDNRQKIIQDNNKLVKARLADAKFFVMEDLKDDLILKLPELKKVVFHQKIGSVYDKVGRLNSVSKFLALFVPHCDFSLVERAANLSKVDLVTKAVAELPELQGKIGSFYAEKRGENPKVAAAIYEHYLPLGPNSALPKTSLGIVLSIADKMDSIAGFFLANEKPTSSKDPYALRRAALGVIRIGLKYDIAFPIRILVEKSLSAYPVKLSKELLKEEEGKYFDNKKTLSVEIIKFIVERLKVYLREVEKLDQTVVNVVINAYLSNLEAHKYCDILYLAKKAAFLDAFVSGEENKKIIELYKRSANILSIEEKKDNKIYGGKVSGRILKTKYEIVLRKRIKQIASPFKKLITKGQFEEAFELLTVLEAPLAHFFENIIVNDKDKNLRESRLILLSKIRDLFDQVGDLSKIDIG